MALAEIGNKRSCSTSGCERVYIGQEAINLGVDHNTNVYD